MLRHAPCASLSLLMAQSGLGRELGCLEVAPRLLERWNWRSQTTGWCGATHRVPVSQRHSATSQEVLWGMPTLTKAQRFAGSLCSHRLPTCAVSQLQGAYASLTQGKQSCSSCSENEGKRDMKHP